MDSTDPTRGRDELTSIGTADVTYDAEPGGRVAASRPRLLTPEARAVTGAFLVLTGLLATTAMIRALARAA